MDTDPIVFLPLSMDDAQAIASWRYLEEYSVYDISPEKAQSSIQYMLDPLSGYFAAYRLGELIGLCSIGIDGQVPNGVYDDSAIDIGAGMRPDLTGKHQGANFLRAVVTFVQSRKGSAVLRATIASWNTRALRAAAAVGFVEHGSFVTPDTKRFVILIRTSTTQNP
jgi:[ribosomal protein S18]-alanine N-acetyltransferase